MLAKIKKWFIEFILITLAISGCTRSAPVNVSSLDNGEKAGKGFSLLPEGLIKKKVSVTPPGDYVQTLTVKEEKLEGAKTRSYGLHVPALYDGKTAVPLVIMLHSTGMSSADFAQITRLMPSRMQMDSWFFIRTHLEKNRYGIPYFSNPAEQMMWFSSLPSSIMCCRTFNIDPKRVFVGGYFDGGMMADKLAAALPEKISAIGVVGASIGYQKAANEVVTLEPALAPVSVFAIHGFVDGVVPYDMTKGLNKGNAGYMPGSDALKYWIQTNGCDPNATVKKTKNENVIKNHSPARMVRQSDGSPSGTGIMTGLEPLTKRQKRQLMHLKRCGNSS